MVKMKVCKIPTLDAVREVKFHINDLLSQIKKGQKWKRKYKKLKKTLKKPVVVSPSYTRRIKPQLEHLDNMFNIVGASPEIRKEATHMCHRIQNCCEVMTKHSKSVAAAVLYTCLKPELGKKDMAKRSGVSIPTITKLSKIIKAYHLECVCDD
jgi:hypothetical protein